MPCTIYADAPATLLPPAKLSRYVDETRAYLHTDEGKRNVRWLMRALGRSYELAVAESVMRVCRLVVYEHIREVTDLVIVEELAGEAA